MSVLAKSADGERGIESGGGAFAGNIADRDSEAAAAVGRKIVEVAGELAGWNVSDREVEARERALPLRQELALNLTCGVEVFLELGAAFLGFRVEPRIFKCDSDVGAEDVEKAFVFGGEGVKARAFKVQDADEALVEQQRDDQFRADIFAVGKFDVARIEADVIHANRAALSGGVTSDALTKRQLNTHRDGLFVLDAEDTFKMGRLLVPEHDIEEMIVNQFAHAISDAAEKFFASEDRSELAADQMEEGEGFVALEVGEGRFLGTSGRSACRVECVAHSNPQRR